MCDQNLDADSYHIFQNESYRQKQQKQTSFLWKTVESS